MAADTSSTRPSSDTSQKVKAQYSLYCYPHCFESQKVIMILAEKNTKYKREVVNIHVGDQYHPDFARLNPKCEVPVLTEKTTGHHVIGSSAIAQYLEKKYSSDAGTPSLVPRDSGLKDKHDALCEKLNSICVEALTYGSLEYTFEQLGITKPKHPYNEPVVRERMRESMVRRTALLQTEAVKLEHEVPEARNALIEKTELVRMELLPLIQDYRKYASLLRKIEAILEECDFLLRVQHDLKSQNWIFGAEISQADIYLALLVHRLWQLGFAKRMWANFPFGRPFVQSFYTRMQNRTSFRKATNTYTDYECPSWPMYVAGSSLALVVLGVVLSSWTGDDGKSDNNSGG